MFFNRKKFFDGVKVHIDRTLTQQQVDGLNRLLKCMEADRYVTNVPLVAYILATVLRETGATFTPIHEYGGKAYFIKRYGGQTRKGKELGNDTPEEGYDYAGKGDTQVTGESNYEKLEVALKREYPEVIAEFERRTGRKFDLTVGDQPNDKKDPQNMLDPVISYISMSYGMRTGLFTGRKIGTFVGPNKRQYKAARAVINGTDHDDEIADSAKKFEKILNAALEDDPVTVTEAFPPLEVLPPAPEPEIVPAAQETAATPAVETVVVQQVIPEADPAPSSSASEPPPDESMLGELEKKAVGIGNRWTALPAIVTTGLLGVWNWATSAEGMVTLGFFAAAAIIVVVYMLNTSGRNAGKEKRLQEERDKNAERAHQMALKEVELKLQREKQAHETQIALIAAGADPKKNNIVIQPMPILNSDPSPTETNSGGEEGASA